MINLLTGLKLLLFAMQYIFNELVYVPANSNTDLFTFIYSISSSRTPPSLCTPFKMPSSVHRSPPTTNPGRNKRSWLPKGLIHSKVRTSRCHARYCSQKPVFPSFPVLVITLSLFMFAGFLWLLISPLIFKTKHIPAHIDPENAYFLDKDEKGPSPFSYERKPPSYNYRYRHYRSPTDPANPKMSTQWLKAQSAWTTTSVDSLATPPPAYHSISTRTPHPRWIRLHSHLSSTPRRLHTRRIAARFENPSSRASRSPALRLYLPSLIPFPILIVLSLDRGWTWNWMIGRIPHSFARIRRRESRNPRVSTTRPRPTFLYLVQPSYTRITIPMPPLQG